MTDLTAFLPTLLASAFGGGLVAGGFSIHNRIAAKNDEHEKWLRDEKIEAYSNYLDATETLALAVQSHRVAMLSQEDLIKKFSESPQGKIDILAPVALRKAAEELSTMLSIMMNESRNPWVYSAELQVAWDAEISSINEQRNEIVRLIQQDLGLDQVDYPISGSELAAR